MQALVDFGLCFYVNCRQLSVCACVRQVAVYCERARSLTALTKQWLHNSNVQEAFRSTLSVDRNFSLFHLKYGIFMKTRLKYAVCDPLLFRLVDGCRRALIRSGILHLRGVSAEEKNVFHS